MTQPTPMRMREKVVLRVVSKLLIPFILLFGLYVQFHGDFGPGGGFQAGVIFAAGFILYGLIFGLDEVEEVVPHRVVEIGSALGVLIYGGVGVATMLLGAEFLDYSVLAHDPVHGRHYGILVIEGGVGLTVFATMMLIFYAFADRGRTSRRDA
jgi:multicomponent Na+:H+ antiporter subunit B